MEEAIQQFITYMKEEKKVSYNTIISYERDLKKVMVYFENLGITQLEEITMTDLNSYILYMENNGFSTATISRSVASLKKFFQYLLKSQYVSFDPTEILKAPKVEKKVPSILTMEEVSLLLQEPKKQTPKSIRDKAMVELLYETGIRSSEMIGLKVSNLNLELGYIICEGEKQERVLPFGIHAKDALSLYLQKSRSEFLKEENDILFLNRNGNKMTRQGFWKNIKAYAKEAGIKREVTPYVIRHSFSMHLMYAKATSQKLYLHKGITTVHE